MDKLDGAFNALSLQLEPDGRSSDTTSKGDKEQLHSPGQLTLCNEDDGSSNVHNGDEPAKEIEPVNTSLPPLFELKFCLIKMHPRWPWSPPERPTEFTRVCDETTFVKFDRAAGFVNELSDKWGSFDFPTWPFIDAGSVINHEHFWGRDSTRPTRYISLCGSAEKLNRELCWRERKGRKEIRVYCIKASQMSYAKIHLHTNESVLCLHERRLGTVYDQRSNQLVQRSMDVIFVNAKLLIDQLGIQSRIKLAAYKTCKDEWLAIQRIPPEMIREQTEID